MKEDITTIRAALKAAKKVAFAHRRGGLHKLYPQLVEGLDALKRIEQQITTTQMPLFPTHITDSAVHQRGT